MDRVFGLCALVVVIGVAIGMSMRLLRGWRNKRDLSSSGEWWAALLAGISASSWYVDLAPDEAGFWWSMLGTVVFVAVAFALCATGLHLVPWPAKED